MSTYVSIFVAIVLVCTTTIIHAANVTIAVSLVAKSKSLSLKQEARALKNSGLWSDKTNTSSSPCQWPGISCNDGGSVTNIDRSDVSLFDPEAELFNISSFPNLVQLKVTGCLFYGGIPPEVGSGSKLTHLNLSNNNLFGELPISLANLTQLVKLDLSINRFSGLIPHELGNLKNLVELKLSENCFSGSIPPEIGNMIKLRYLSLHTNQINDSIPLEIANMRELRELSLHANQISGSIPLEIGSLTKLVVLNLSANNLVGSIPPSFGHLTHLTYLDIHSNNINGSISYQLTQLIELTQLQTVSLAFNELSGSIPHNIKDLLNLSVLDLSHNMLSGPFPTQLANCYALKQLFLNYNYLKGSIPPQVANLSMLITIDLSHNFFSGVIPSEIGHLKYLQYLDLSHNKLSGNIPETLVSQSYVDLSYNSLEGEIPHGFWNSNSPWSVYGNRDLCSNIAGYGVPKCSFLHHSHLLRFLIIIITASLGLLLVGIAFFYRHKVTRYTPTESRATTNGDLFSIWNYEGNITYEEIIKATQDFDIRYCIGTGGYGSVYKVQLPNGKIVALKKLHRLEAEEPAFDKSFRNEAKVLSEIRHRNIIKLYGFCLHRRCMFLVYEYMEGGSLFWALNNDSVADVFELEEAGEHC